MRTRYRHEWTHAHLQVSSVYVDAYRHMQRAKDPQFKNLCLPRESSEPKILPYSSCNTYLHTRLKTHK